MKTVLDEVQKEKRSTPRYIYLLLDGPLEIGGMVKVGVARDVKARLRKLQTGNPRPLSIARALMMGSSTHAFRVEREFKDRFRAQNILNEWFCINQEIMDVING